MKLSIEITKEMLTSALNTELSSLKRSKTAAKMPQFIPIIERQISDYERALLTIAEIKDTSK